jgi:hypothetical protein
VSEPDAGAHQPPEVQEKPSTSAAVVKSTHHGQASSDIMTGFSVWGPFFFVSARYQNTPKLLLSCRSRQPASFVTLLVLEAL